MTIDASLPPAAASRPRSGLPAEVVTALAAHPAPDIEPLVVRYFGTVGTGRGRPEVAPILEEMVRRTAGATPADDRFWWVQARLWMGGFRLNHPRSVGELEESRRLAGEVLAASSGVADAHYLHAAAGVQLGVADARQRLALALALMSPDGPNYAEARHADAMLRLREGDFAAWAEYARWLDSLTDRQFDCPLPTPRWDGSCLDGRTILLHTVQDGDGDAIQMARYVPVVKAMGARVTVVCNPGLAQLFRRVDGADLVITADASILTGAFRLEGPRHESLLHDVHARLMNLPAILGTTLETIPASIPYLASSDEATERWRPVVGTIPGLRVGVCWQGNPEHCSDAFRSFRVADLAPLAKVPGVTLVSLQKNAGADQLADAPFPIVELGPDYAAGDWLDTAAVVGELDLVIAPDTAIGHLAGALGKPTWLALARPSEWRWMDDRDDSPWYPTMRLFRQDRLGEWGPVFRRMADRLARETPR